MTVIGSSGKHYGSPKFSRVQREETELKRPEGLELVLNTGYQVMEEELTLTRGAWKGAWLGKDRPVRLLVRM